MRHVVLLCFQSRDCVNEGPPDVGEAVQVKWPDGLFYGAKYLGSSVSYMYQVHRRTHMDARTTRAR